MAAPDFSEFPKMPRLTRECIITEKLDGTNGQILITEAGDMFVGSRNRWITTEDDNFGFAAWCEKHRAELVAGLGVGRHFGEWWGSGIQRGYGLKNGEKRFSLFNAIVPVLYRGDFDTTVVAALIDDLRTHGSFAVQGFMKPEGLVCYHIAGGVGFKKTLEKDSEPKGLAVVTSNTEGA